MEQARIGFVAFLDASMELSVGCTRRGSPPVVDDGDGLQQGKIEFASGRVVDIYRQGRVPLKD